LPVAESDGRRVVPRILQKSRQSRDLRIGTYCLHVNALGMKGVGEIGITGSAGAVANAVWHATGVRVRRFPIKIADLLTAR
jgi:hypothetical protein